MRIERVKAIAFGRLADEELELAPGMTVVHGPNEAGKSTWHDALYAGLCGRRRARGGRTRAERDFEDRRRPWSRDEWRVGVDVELADGRRIALHHDLDGMVDCSATDRGLGRDVSAEILHEGAPDGALWLGLDRHTFSATACVRQAEVLGVLAEPDRLQQHLQRAAAGAGRDQTAATALERIDAYLRENVGVDRAGARKPLRLAQERVDEAERGYARAATDHESFLRLAADAEVAATVADDAAARLRALHAARAARGARDGRARIERARSIAKRFPEGAPPPHTADDALAQQVSAALSAWKRRPEARRPEGPSADDLSRVIAALPESPEGDREAHDCVTAAARHLHDTRHAVELHRLNRPRDPEPEDAKVGVEALRELAHELSEADPAVDPLLEKRVEEARRDVARAERRRRSGIAGGLLLATAGLAVVLLGRPVPGFTTAVAGLVALLAFLVRRDDGLQPGPRRRLRDAELALATAQHAVRVAGQRRDRARERAELLGLEATPHALRRRAEEIAERDADCRRLAEWEKRQAEVAGRRAAAEAALAEALRSRGAEVTGPVDAAHRAYLTACQDRARQGSEAARREGLEAQRAARAASERALAQAEEAIASAGQGLRECAERCRVEGDSEETLVRGLSEWLQRRREFLAQHDAAVREYAELEAMLGGGTLEELEREVARAEQRASQLAEALDDDTVPIVLSDDADAQLARLEREERETSREAQRLRGQVEERASALASVPAAEEALASAREELERVRSLQRTLELTRGYLRSAQERVYRSIAPMLADTLRAWLPRVTGSRYRDASVDPASLEVQVCEPGGAWRPAARLSHGTAEQIYLLLRMALAAHLTLPGEPCPLVLDEVTVQADAERTRALLDLLHAVSRERQVILFSQEAEVLEWADAHLAGSPDDRIVRLASPPAA